MTKTVTRLLPGPQAEIPLPGLYLEDNQHRQARADRPYIYSNFITTLDGRIAVAGDGRSTLKVPEVAANPRDWRLYQELAGRADILISSGRFFRQTGVGEAQDALPIGPEQDYDDIRDWRERQGMKLQPDIAILSSSLDIPVATLAAYRCRRILVFTGSNASSERAQQLTDAGIEVIHAGADRHVEGSELVQGLAVRGYRSVYAIAGPAVLHTLLAARALDRLYLTLTTQILGGIEYDTLCRGPALSPAGNLQLASLYLDRHAPDGASQLLAALDPA